MTGRTVMCDATGCRATPPPVRFYRSSEAAIRQAVSLGWLCDKSGDWCPKHRDDHHWIEHSPDDYEPHCSRCGIQWSDPERKMSCRPEDDE